MDTTVNKLILLYVFDQMEIPVTNDTLVDMCCSQNNWLSYMNLTQILSELLDTRFIVECDGSGTTYYKITQEGRSCVNFFFSKIPASQRAEISSFIKQNRLEFKRNQEYFKDYYKNKDDTYTVNLKIIDPTGSKLELKLNVPNRAEAKSVFNKWNDLAGDVYSAIYKILVDGE